MSKKNKYKFKKSPSKLVSDKQYSEMLDSKQAWRNELLNELSQQMRFATSFYGAPVKEKHTLGDWKIAYLSNCVSLARINGGIENPLELAAIKFVQERLNINKSQIGESFILAIQMGQKLYEFENDYTARHCYEDMVFISISDGEIHSHEMELMEAYGRIIKLKEHEIITAWNSAKLRHANFMKSRSGG